MRTFSKPTTGGPACALGFLIGVLLAVASESSFARSGGHGGGGHSGGHSRGYSGTHAGGHGGYRSVAPAPRVAIPGHGYGHGHGHARTIAPRPVYGYAPRAAIALRAAPIFVAPYYGYTTPYYGYGYGYDPYYAAGAYPPTYYPPAQVVPEAAYVPPPQVVAPPVTAQAAPTTVPADISGFPYRYVGKMVSSTQTTVMLAAGQRQFTVQIGDTIDGLYRVDRISDTEIVLTDLRGDNTLSLSIR
jgi:hypothetical protein